MCHFVDGRDDRSNHRKTKFYSKIQLIISRSLACNSWKKELIALCRHYYLPHQCKLVCAYYNTSYPVPFEQADMWHSFQFTSQGSIQFQQIIKTNIDIYTKVEKKNGKSRGIGQAVERSPVVIDLSC